MERMKIVNEVLIDVLDTETHIEIPSNVTAIGKQALSNCKNMTELTIPKNVINIEENAFDGCDNLSKINWNSPIRITQEMLEKMFEKLPNLKVVNYNGKEINKPEKKEHINIKSLDDIIFDELLSEVKSKNPKKAEKIMSLPEKERLSELKKVSLGIKSPVRSNHEMYKLDSRNQFFK